MVRTGGQIIEIPAVARQSMDADNNSTLARAPPFVVSNAMKAVGIQCEKAVLVGLRLPDALRRFLSVSHKLLRAFRSMLAISVSSSFASSHRRSPAKPVLFSASYSIGLVSNQTR